MLIIRKIEIGNEFSLLIEFDDGKVKKVNLKPFLNKGIFQQLKDPAYFQLVKNNGYFISWPNDQELSADTLYYC
jgi:hypothetical protein